MVHNAAVRQLKIYPVEGAAMLLRCSDCEWQYRFENRSALVDEIEKSKEPTDSPDTIAPIFRLTKSAPKRAER